MAEAVSAERKVPQARRRMSRRSKDLVQSVRSMIVSFELPPGSVVSEGQLVRQLGAGRTPVREALLILAHEYLVKQVPGMGSTIAGLDIEEYALITELQEGLEPFAARLAAERITEDELQELDSIITRARLAAEAGDVNQVVQLNLRFHETVLTATQNKYIVDTGMRLNRYIIRFWHFAFARGMPMLPAIEENARIAEALRRHDPAEAERVVFAHWADALSRLWGAV